MTGQDLIASILSGDHDQHLDGIARAVKERRQTVAHAFALTLSPGDTVHFSTEIKPRYLEGREATVVRVNQASVTVDCPADPAYQRYAGARGVRCPNALIAELA